jgi:ADP-ribosylglycohydrolase
MSSSANTSLHSKVAGAFYGQFIGDALGTRYEFSDSTSTQKQIASDVDQFGFLNIKGGGPFRLDVGQVTDDTELWCALLCSIFRKGTYNQDEAAKHYIQWFNSHPFDIGTTTSGALENAQCASDVLKNSAYRNRSSQSNGCLMRVSCLGVLGACLNSDILLNYAEQDCCLTNPNKHTIDAVRVYVTIIASLVNSVDKIAAIKNGFKVAKTTLVQQLIIDSEKTADTVMMENGKRTTADQNMGYFGIALTNALYELRHGTSFSQSLVNIVKKGGDTDTNGCIAGALLGAYYGADEIPGAWKDAVKTCKNPRVESYRYVDQTCIDTFVSHMVTIIEKSKISKQETVEYKQTC